MPHVAQAGGYTHTLQTSRP